MEDVSDKGDRQNIGVDIDDNTDISEESDPREDEELENEVDTEWCWPKPDCCIHKICPSYLWCDGCLTLIFAVLMVIVGMLLLLCVVLPMAIANPTYQEGSCYRARGIAILKQCSVQDCTYCSQDCWMTYEGISAVPNVTVYLFRGTYDNYDTVNRIVTGSIGMYLGKCWYRDGGADVMWYLYNIKAGLIVGTSIIGIGLLIISLLLFMACYQLKFYAGLCSSITRSLARLRYKLCGRSGYVNVDYDTPLEDKQ